MTGAPVGLRVAVLADDLIWSSRLSGLLREIGDRPVTLRSLESLAEALADETRSGEPIAAVIVDLTARAYDGIAAVALAAGAGRPVLAAVQHDDHALLRRARDAGARPVVAYRRLAEHGTSVVATWLADVRDAQAPIPSRAGTTR